MISSLQISSNFYQDWFLPAVLHEGSLAECLQIVNQRLTQQAQILEAISYSLVGNKLISDTQQNIPTSDTQHIDRVTRLGQKLKIFESTLRFRLGLLHPEQEGAWFREAISKTFGPFTREPLLQEAIFAPYEKTALADLKHKLLLYWQEGKVGPLPFTEQRGCMWSLLLEMNFEYHQICTIKLPPTLEPIRLDLLPEKLPETIESKAFRAFLINVQQELLNLKDRLESCFKNLLLASEKLWDMQEKKHQTKTAQDLRNEFQKQRQKRRHPTNFSLSKTRQALSILGFDHEPELTVLKERYLSLAKKWHPDRSGGDEDQFKKIVEAYQHLTSALSKNP